MKKIFFYDKYPEMRHSFYSKIVLKNPPHGWKFTDNADDADIVYSSGHPSIPFDKPYVVEIIDKAHALVGYNMILYRLFKGKVKRQLEKAKAVIVWGEICKRQLMDMFDIPEEKIHVIPFAMTSKDYERDYDGKKKLNFLFMGSRTNVDDFILKGGYDILALAKLMPEHKFTIRCKVPEDIAFPENCNVIDILLTEEEIAECYKKADALILPAYTQVGLTQLEAMSYGLPVIAYDVWGQSESVIDGENGILIPIEDRIDQLNVRTKKSYRLIKESSEVNADKLFRACAFLESADERRRLGKNGKNMVDSPDGRFSIERRNRMLKEILEK